MCVVQTWDTIYIQRRSWHQGRFSFRIFTFFKPSLVLYFILLFTFFKIKEKFSCSIILCDMFNIKPTHAAIGPNQIVELFDNIKEVLQDINLDLLFHYNETKVKANSAGKEVVILRAIKVWKRANNIPKLHFSLDFQTHRREGK